MQAMPIVLGVDPGSRYTGWGIITNSSPRSSDLACLGYGVLAIGESEPLSQRLGRLLKLFNETVEQYRPDCLAVEKVFMAKNVDSAFKLGHARGAILAVAGAHGLPVYEYATRHVKKMLTGNGAAGKEQVQWMIEHLLHIQENRLDATDALALAVCHARESEVAQLLREHSVNEVEK